MSRRFHEKTVTVYINEHSIFSSPNGVEKMLVRINPAERGKIVEDPLEFP